ncbi:SpoIIE family protein phosphatase [candidate division KSB1 bacterium]|nr:SpoIIE family protein phosphatase [candidate division KSB1 bacterium]
MEREKMRAREATLRAQTAEAESRAIKAENARKTHELEEARALQLSMLPKQLPQVSHLDIAVHMQTATEVGGDYYDFRIDDHGHLTVVVGDATGHGLNAGMMVSVIKSLFIADVFNGDHRSFLKKCSHTIRQLQLGNLYMAMTLVKIINNELIVSAAGMPPAYVYRAKSKNIEEVLIKGMPLGAVANYDYQDRRITLQDGDTILLLTDGLPEMSNEHKQMFDYHRVEDVFKHSADKPAQQVIDRLVEAGRQWRPHANPNDDVTFVVIKIKAQQVE